MECCGSVTTESRKKQEKQSGPELTPPLEVLGAEHRHPGQLC